ncbi:Uncharacterised protein [Suttonella ornithocola]|uniref:Transposase IS4-like domain-containing protein n=1 Tax=Suttonella ornithocola TaxID=279832 RepID=A0A380MTL8_9GAMM|nr:Uncharacterised protein [Suttonella ornithocola]
MFFYKSLTLKIKSYLQALYAFFLGALLYYKSVAGNSSKIHLVVDVYGNLVVIEVSAGQRHDSQMVITLRDHSQFCVRIN